MMMTKCRFCSKVVLVGDSLRYGLDVDTRRPTVEDLSASARSSGTLKNFQAPQLTDHIGELRQVALNGAHCAPLLWTTRATYAFQTTQEPALNVLNFCALQGWKQHLQTICYNNPRRNGPEIDIDPNLMVGDGRAARPSSTKSVRSMKAVAGRTIDADKLVAALQTVQLRKKQDAAKKKAAIAGKSEAVDGTQSAK
ncbi:unnamed protein product [Heligmosomoides polygyrus]|uniref:Uracil-DNA glycosylase n=1 Tax=Heligmosomoides polygyrus TaxID=6339 RepID=A0A183GKF2_HELPZ|nr:unnamed protein product [Heligmosomoides polygyrus]